MIRKREEEKLQNRCEGLLETYKIKYLHLTTAINRRIAGERHSFSVEGNKGYPDLMILLPGRIVLFVELKSKAGKLTNEQKMVMEELQGLGFQYHVCRDFDVFREIIEKERKKR